MPQKKRQNINFQLSFTTKNLGAIPLKFSYWKVRICIFLYSSWTCIDHRFSSLVLHWCDRKGTHELHHAFRAMKLNGLLIPVPCSSEQFRCMTCRLYSHKNNSDVPSRHVRRVDPPLQQRSQFIIKYKGRKGARGS